MPLSEVKFPGPPLTDIPGMLRKAADEIESLDPDFVQIAVLILVSPGEEDANVSVRAFGRVSNSVETLGWLVKATKELI